MEELTVLGACPLDCPDTCGWTVTMRDGVATGLRGDPAEKVAEITGVPAERIVALGTRIARTRPTAIRATMGMQRHAGGGTALRTLACLPAVTGDWGRPGGGLSYSTSGHFGLDRAALYRDDLRPRPVRTLSMTRLGHILSTVDDRR